MDTRHKNLMFLLAASSLSAGCVFPVDDGGTDATPPGSGSTSATTSPTSTTSTSAGSDGPATSDCDGTSTTGGSSDSSGEGSTAGETGTTTGDPGVGACTMYADLITECYTEKEGTNALGYCVEYLGYLYDAFGADCLTAQEEYLVCLSGLTCEEFESPGACATEAMAVATSCSGTQASVGEPRPTRSLGPRGRRSGQVPRR